MSDSSIEQKAQTFRNNVDKVEAELSKTIVGHQGVIRQVMVALVAGGHVLLEGVPGIGKTLLVRSLAQAIDLEFSRIQFTPDLMPADITGTNIIVEEESGRRSFEFQKGPVFGNILLADEINRATPKTQSALLEAMQEQAVTVSGTHYPLPDPFFVMATQNPIEMEGTYPLPEAQLDRFLFKIEVPRPGLEDLVGVINRTTGTPPEEIRPVISAADIVWMRNFAREVEIAGPLANYVARLVLSTHNGNNGAIDEVNKYVRYGASPRGAQAIVTGAKVTALINGRFNVSYKDIHAVAHPSLRHRVILNFEGEAEKISAPHIIDRLQETVKE